ncbi:homeodomain-interacting protein kinase 3-like [Paralichthys olivaceus]|uniref:homeodomain-interacting protein kinase 3-like n=1 Tax=Paralichthys olivaceus TaxID=8255 RepID=UPI0037513DBE
MSSRESTGNDSAASVALTAHEVQAGDVLHSSSSSYSVLELIGEGAFGKIAASMNLRTKEHVAIKILNNKESTQDSEQEVSILKLIGETLDSDRTNMVKFHEQFVHMEQNCLVFERLHMSLYDLLKWREWKYLPLHHIRPVAKQLLVTLEALKGVGVLHTDIKPDNIMFVHLQDQPLRVKLIDFGSAMMTSQIELGKEIQPYGYRAPEISLGLPFTEAVDVWGVACILAFLYMAENLFCISCEYQMMKGIVTVLGQPEDRLLRDGENSWRFFIDEQGADSSSWRLLTAEEFTAANDLETEELPSSLSSLSSLILFHPELEAAEREDRMAFVSLLEGLLHVDGDQRMTSGQALQHPFITMSHLTEDVDSWDYLTTSKMTMKVYPDEDSVHGATSDNSYSDTMDKVSSNSVEALVSQVTSVPKLSTGDSAEVCDSDLSNSKDTSVPSIKEDDTSELSWCSDVAVDINAAATASSGGKRKLLRRIRKFFSSLISCCRPKVED